jgi:hypothetical protein
MEGADDGGERLTEHEGTHECIFDIPHDPHIPIDPFSFLLHIFFSSKGEIARLNHNLV